MILVVGGAYQGKKQFACENFGLAMEEFVDGRECAFGALNEARAMHHLQDYIRRMLLEGLDAKQIIRQEVQNNPSVVILCNELGCGLVPIERFDREYRESVGRIQCELAKQAEGVYRIYCGIGEKLL